MGAAPSRPAPGTTMAVIGAGYSRTGTSSFTEALEILLDGPVYHAGTQVAYLPSQLVGWCEVFDTTPLDTSTSRDLAKQRIGKLLDGYAGCTDIGPNQYVGELMELYPNAKVICTTRDADSWVKSLLRLADSVYITWYSPLRVLFLVLPELRHWSRFIQTQERRRLEIYDPPNFLEDPKELYFDHLAYLKRVVPKEKLLFFDVKDGWEPLCKILNVPVPDVPFPRVNEYGRIQQYRAELVAKAWKRWTWIGAGLAVSVGVRMALSAS